MFLQGKIYLEKNQFRRNISNTNDSDIQTPRREENMHTTHSVVFLTKFEVLG